MDFNDAINKTKEVIEIAKDKTVEAVNIGKMKYDIAAQEKELEKLFTKLGITAYEKFGSENLNDQLSAIVSQIKNKKEQIEAAKKELLKVKAKRLCPKCNNAVAEDAVFCSVCGEKLIFTEEENA